MARRSSRRCRSSSGSSWAHNADLSRVGWSIVSNSPRKTSEAIEPVKPAYRHALAVVIAIAFAVHLAFAAPEHYGQVTFGGLPVPGAAVTASRGDTHVAATTD